MSKHDPQPTLVDQSQALDLYLTALLSDVPEYDPEQETTAAEAPALRVVEPTVSDQQVAATEAEVEVEAEAKPQPDGARPDWSQETFQALLFKVAGLTLAIPLIELNGIVEWSDDITPLPNHSPWYLGLLNHRGQNVSVMDTGQLIFPPEKRAGAEPSAWQRIILIGDGRYGLACEEVSEVISLAPDEVRWRSARTSRKWLLGTVIDHMCALIDAPEFAAMLAGEAEDGEDEVPPEAD